MLPAKNDGADALPQHLATFGKPDPGQILVMLIPPVQTDGTAVFRTKILHLCGFDSIRDLVLKGRNLPAHRQLLRKFDPKDLSLQDVS